MEYPDIRTVMKYEFLCRTLALQATQNTNKSFGFYCYYATDNINVKFPTGQATLTLSGSIFFSILREKITFINLLKFKDYNIIKYLRNVVCLGNIQFKIDRRRVFGSVSKKQITTKFIRY